MRKKTKTQPMNKKKLVDLQPVDPFNYLRLYGPEKYSLNNMELISVNMPARIEEDKQASFWTDHSYKEWEAAQKNINSRGIGDAWWSEVSPSDLLKFAQRVATAIGFEYPVTGARIVRFTNGAQYPTLRLDIVSGGEGRLTPPKHQYYDPLEYTRD